ncbi:MAG: PIN domain-containing protein [Tessaracoccus sp.]|uniref:TA system VapC family ribonuclease toxin n=1 Tax=Tessaracoccus sp. TaxID=1971211 RepID=UPI001EBD8586|nr:TA system VapC family ribonuclease toxin [Tessaracoccus sp.]MBK7821888.1 PIN domain-containing protein [Tessaracoccus sp.]
MTTALLDVNVLIALLDPNHTQHGRVHDWATDELDGGWSTCAITQNGLVRILSQPRYPNAVSTPAAVELLRGATQHPRHEFWPCDLPLTDPSIIQERILGPNQITDVFLFALAVAHGGRFVTLDRRIDASMVHGAPPAHLVLL